MSALSVMPADVSGDLHIQQIQVDLSIQHHESSTGECVSDWVGGWVSE